MNIKTLSFQQRYGRITIFGVILIALCTGMYAMLASADQPTSPMLASHFVVDKSAAESAELLTYEITLRNPTDETVRMSVINELAYELALLPQTVTMSQPTVARRATTNAIFWTGEVAADESVVISYQATIHGTRAQVGQDIINEAYVIVGDVGSVIAAETEIVATSATASRDASRDFTTSTLTVDHETAMPGDTLEYTITMNNSGDEDLEATMSDALPDGTTYVANSLSSTGGLTTSWDYDSTTETITWTGTIETGESATVTFSAELDESGLNEDEVIANEASISASSGTVQVSAETTIELPSTDRRISMLPVIFQPLEAPFLSLLSKPSSSNARTLGWTNEGNGVTYELQVDQNAQFSSPELVADAITGLSYVDQPAATYENTLYYRVRTRSANGGVSDWSNTISVVGAYFDDFNTAESGWDIRRLTYLGEVRSFYETHASWYVIQVDDKWDWGLASPMRPAPEPPYRVRMRMQPVNNGNLISFGMVTRGNWENTGEACIDYSSLKGVYERMNCFTEFYNANLINQGGYGEELKLLWEGVDYLIWCPECGNSPMKRLSNDVGSWVEVQSVPNVTQGHPVWNEWQIDVYEDRQVISVNGRTFATYNRTAHNDNPYFGIFASTDEYNNSTWRIDWVRVTPIDQ